MSASRIPITLFYSGEYKGAPTNWFIPNFACLREWLIESGFQLGRYGFDDRKAPTQRFWGCAKKVKGLSVLPENVLVDRLNRGSDEV